MRTGLYCESCRHYSSRLLTSPNYSHCPLLFSPQGMARQDMAWQGKERKENEREEGKWCGRRRALIWCAVSTYRGSRDNTAFFGLQ